MPHLGIVLTFVLDKTYVDTWLMSLDPIIGESVYLWKRKTLVRKKILQEPSLQTTLYPGKIVAMSKHKTSLRKQILCLAKPAEKPVEGEKLQVVCDICDICCCMSGLRCKCLWKGRLWANLAYCDS